MRAADRPAAAEAERITAEEVERGDIPSRIAVEDEQRGGGQRADRREIEELGAGEAAAEPPGCPQQRDQQRIELEVDGDIPDAGGKRLIAEQVMQQKQMGDELAERRRGADRVVRHPAARQRGADRRQQQGNGVGADQPQIAPADQVQRRNAGRQATQRQPLGGEKAGDREEGGDGVAAVVGQPAEAALQQRREVDGDVAERTVPGEVMQHDELRGDGLDGIDQRQAAHALRSPAHAAICAAPRRRPAPRRSGRAHAAAARRCRARA